MHIIVHNQMEDVTCEDISVRKFCIRTG